MIRQGYDARTGDIAPVAPLRQPRFVPTDPGYRRT